MLGCKWEINLSLKIGISVTTKQIEWVLFYESMANKVRYYRDKRKNLLEDIRSLQANVKEGRLLKYFMINGMTYKFHWKIFVHLPY